MNERVSIFSNLTVPPVVATKPKKETPVEEAAIEQVAEAHNFPSRQAKKAPKIEKRKPRIYRTGRNVQFNAKITAETNAKIYRLADERDVTLGKLLEMAMESLVSDEGNNGKT
jgi:hypothetical protein